MNEETAALIKRCNAAWIEKTNWDALYDDAYSLALPQRNIMRTQRAGSAKNNEVFDSTLQQCTVKLAGLLQTSITPPMVNWARIVPGSFVPEEERNAKAKEYDYATQTVFAALKPSNFDAAIGEFFLDLIIGTGAMLVLDGGDKSPFQFVTVPIAEIALEEGAFNQIGGVFRRYKKPCRTLRSMWPDMKETPGYNEILKNDPGKLIDLNEITTYDPKSEDWKYVVVMGGMNASEADIIVKRTFAINPWIVSRWIKVAGETFGRGPVINALPDAKTVNMAKKLELQNASLAISGVWTARNNGIFNSNSIRIVPGAVIPVQSNAGAMGPDLQRLDVGGDVRFSQIVTEDLRASIKAAMYDRSLPVQGAVRSATEWIVRQAELQEQIGAPIGRLHQELLRPLFARLISILASRGIFPPIELNGGDADIQITGTLAQSANLRQVETIQSWGQAAAALAGPEVWQSQVKVESIPGYLNELFGVAPQLMRSEEEKQQMMQMAAQAAQAQAAAQQQQARTPEEIGEENV